MKHSEKSGLTVGLAVGAGIAVGAGVSAIAASAVVGGTALAGVFLGRKIYEYTAHKIGVQMGGKIHDFAATHCEKKPLLNAYLTRLGKAVEKSVETALNDIDADVDYKEKVLETSLDLAGAKMTQDVLQESVDEVLHKSCPCLCPAFVRSRIAAVTADSIVTTTKDCLQEARQSLEQGLQALTQGLQQRRR